MKRILQLNCQGAFRTKYKRVVEWCSKHECVIAAISETKLCHETCSSPHRCARVPHIDGWEWVGRSRNIHGGGVGFLIDQAVCFRQRKDLRTEDVEDEWIEVIDEKT